MTFSDEQLSAFLDAELAENEMEALRQALATDEALADRLSELALVDSVIARAYATIDQRPVPDAVTNLLSSADTNNNTDTKVTALPAWQRLRRTLQPQLAIAATVALFVGFGLARLLPDAGQTQWQSVADALETSPSGISQPLTEDMAITPRLTYLNTEGDYCRQFQLVRSNGTEDSIACRKGGQWNLAATVYLPPVTDDGVYRTASGGSALDAVLDQSMASAPFDADTESSLISNAWTAATGASAH